MIKIKTQEEIQVMAEGGRILGRVLTHLVKNARPGITTLELDREAEKEILEAGGEPSFKTVPRYKFTTCLCVNEVVVHGIPTDYRLQKGDILGIDVGLLYKGFHTDAAWTVIVGNQESRRRQDSLTSWRSSGPKAAGVRDQGGKRFLEVGKEALKKAISVAREGNHVGDISQAIQTVVEGAGYSVVRTLVGHGIGRKLHEDPEVPGFVTGKPEVSPLLREGMTLAIEVIYNMGSAEVTYRKDGWTIASWDGSLSGLFEKTVAITKAEPIILTP
ncbi:MAG: M24 family metallopeptidase [bacterium]|nr:M24 family metallopeptidase [bacterium]